MPASCLPLARLLFFVFVSLGVLASGIPAEAASRAALRDPQGLVVASEAEAARAGAAVLRAGGNAVDAAVAVALALAVTDPQAGNLGGGGFLLYRDPEGTSHALDFRETAPRRIEARDFLDGEGRPVPQRSLRGGLAIGTPGSVAGLAEAHARWGTRSWASLVAPAVRLARRGFRISRRLAAEIADESALLLEDPETRRVLAPRGKLPVEGQILVQSDLARTLDRIARHGAAGFYEGKTALAIERTVLRTGGILDREDLANYRAVRREPLVGTYRGHRVVTFPPPSSGGVALLEILGLLERFDLAASGPGSSTSIHLMAEAERRAFADRSRWLGDPDQVSVPVAGLLAREFLEFRGATIRLDRATPSAEVLPGDPQGAEPQDTLHFSVADSHGGAVALTTTLNTAFGSGIIADGTGVLLNNEMDDFSLAPGAPNTYGLTGAEANAVAAGKRPLSSMCPTIVESPEKGARPRLVLGSPGGPRIITSVLQVLVNHLDHEMPLQEAVDAARFHHQWQPDVILHEPRAFPADVERELRRIGHQLRGTTFPLGNVNAIGLDASGAWLGAADPRREGAVALASPP